MTIKTQRHRGNMRKASQNTKRKIRKQSKIQENSS